LGSSPPIHTRAGKLRTQERPLTRAKTPRKLPNRSGREFSAGRERGFKQRGRIPIN
jgi:hypothetical protein